MNTKLIDHTILSRIFLGEIKISGKEKTVVSVHSIAIFLFLIQKNAQHKKPVDVARFLLSCLDKIYHLHNQKIIQIVGFNNSDEAFFFSVTKMDALRKNLSTLSDNFLWVVSLADAYKYDLVSSRSKRKIYEKFSSLRMEYI